MDEEENGVGFSLKLKAPKLVLWFLAPTRSVAHQVAALQRVGAIKGGVVLCLCRSLAVWMPLSSAKTAASRGGRIERGDTNCR